MQIKVNDFLTFEKQDTDAEVSFPISNSKMRSQWWKKLPSDANKISQCPHHESILEMHGHRTSKLCVGLQGSGQIGYTIPLDKSFCPERECNYFYNFYKNVKSVEWPNYVDGMTLKDLPNDIQFELLNLHNYDTTLENETVENQFHDFQISGLHPEMVHGTDFAELTEDDYKWQLYLIRWPWRAKLPKGWRLLVIENPLLFRTDCKVFTGCVDANYVKYNDENMHREDNYTQTLDFDNYNYFFVDAVMAVRRNEFVELSKEDPIISLIPVYDPDYKPVTRSRFPNFTK